MKKVFYDFSRVLFFISLIFISCDNDPNNDNNKTPNKWEQLTNFGGSEREGAVAFVINNKIYAGLATYNDFWEFDLTTKTWTQKTNFPSQVYAYSVSFSIGNKGYVGVSGNKEFWEYNPSKDEWIQKADYPGETYYGVVYFSSETKGYVGLGDMGYSSSRDFWEYDPSTNIWTQKADFLEEGGRYCAKGLYLNGKGYVFTGATSNHYTNGSNGFWEYNIELNQWVRKSNYPVEIYGGICFAIKDKIYAGLGYSSYRYRNYKDIYEFDQSGNKWIKKTDYPGGGTRGSIAVVVQDKAYIGLGVYYTSTWDIVYNDFWQYTP